jgi:hypothetical protein
MALYVVERIAEDLMPALFSTTLNVINGRI